MKSNEAQERDRETGSIAVEGRERKEREVERSEEEEERREMGREDGGSARDRRYEGTWREVGRGRNETNGMKHERTER